MRARNIKPGFFKNENLVECSIAARLLAPGLWMMADREGRLEDRPKQIKIEIFPCDNVDVDQLLAELAYHQHIKRYEIGGKRFIQICKFNEHQRPHNNETESYIPNENGDFSKPKEKILPPKVESASDKPESTSLLISDSLNPESLNPEKEEVEGSLRSPAAPSKKSKPDYSEDFEDFWKGWEPFDMPKGDKGDALKNYTKARKEADHATIIAGRNAYIAECHRLGNKTKHACTWLNKCGWTGDYDATGETIGRHLGGNAGGIGPKMARTGYDPRDPASVAHDEGQRIIAERRERWAEEDAAKRGQGGAGATDAIAIPDLRQPEHLRGQSPDDGIPRSDVPGDFGMLPHIAH